MTKAELISIVSKDSGIDKTIASHLVENLITAIKEQMTKGNNIYIRGFGTFKRTTRKAKKARNINENTQILIPSRVQPTFKACKTFKEQVTLAARIKKPKAAK